MNPGWYFDDAQPGERLEHPLARTVGRDEHVWLAWLTNNQSDVHGNAHRAAQTAWGGPLVLGALSVAIVIGLAQPAEPLELRVRPPAGWQSISLGRPVLPGDTLRAMSDIHECQAADDGSGGLVLRTIYGVVGAGDIAVTVRETVFAPAR